MLTDSNTDKILFTRIAEGDEDAFRALFHAYAPEVRPMVYRLTQTLHAVDDLVQEIFFKIWMVRDTLVDIENPHGWIMKVTFTQCFGYLRKQSVREKFQVSPMDAFGEKQGSHNDQSAEERLDYKFTMEKLSAAIDRLPTQARKVYKLSRVEGLKTPEIADRLELSVQTVKNTMSRALKAIREDLQGQGITLPTVLIALYCHFFSMA